MRPWFNSARPSSKAEQVQSLEIEAEFEQAGVLPGRGGGVSFEEGGQRGHPDAGQADPAHFQADFGGQAVIVFPDGLAEGEGSLDAATVLAAEAQIDSLSFSFLENEPDRDAQFASLVFQG